MLTTLCFALFRDDVCVFVGKGDDIRAELLKLLHGSNPCVTAQNPNKWGAIVAAKPDNSEQDIIQHYRPVCN